jgi:hypothetical protein
MYKKDHLLNLYNNWIVNPKDFNEEMKEVIDKIIYSTVRKQSLDPIYRRIEDNDDLAQELRALCFSKLRKISEPTNKRIYNYLKVCIKLNLKDRCRKVGKYLDREVIENSILGDKNPNNFFCFGDSMLDRIAYLLAYGSPKKDICLELNISRPKLQKEIERLKEFYE